MARVGLRSAAAADSGEAVSMSARYVTPHLEHHDSYWLGRLSMALALCLQKPDPRDRDTLDDFLKSGKPSDELKAMLREEMKV